MTGASFAALLWSDIAPFYDQVTVHPFITGLLDGSLPRESFQHYLLQDTLYLDGLARVLVLCAAKADLAEDVAMFARHAAETTVAEQELHASLLAELGLAGVARLPALAGPTTRAYLSYLLSVAYAAPYGEVVGALLPCYWFYARVGDKLRAAGSPDPLYARWINAYAGPNFQRMGEEMVAATERLGDRLGEAEQHRVRDRVRVAARYEWMFWDASYRRESWPI